MLEVYYRPSLKIKTVGNILYINYITRHLGKFLVQNSVFSNSYKIACNLELHHLEILVWCLQCFFLKLYKI